MRKENPPRQRLAHHMRYGVCDFCKDEMGEAIEIEGELIYQCKYCKPVKVESVAGTDWHFHLMMFLCIPILSLVIVSLLSNKPVSSGTVEQPAFMKLPEGDYPPMDIIKADEDGIYVVPYQSVDR